MLTQHYLISGRVQGVNFRVFTQQQAEQLGLKGWVRNLNDGRVEALVQGSQDRMKLLEEKLRLGPKASKVDAVEAYEFKTHEVFRSFEIKATGESPCQKI